MTCRCGTGSLRKLIVNDWINRSWIDAHTVAFDELRKAVLPYTLEHAAELCEWEQNTFRRAHELSASSRVG
jgi:anaerobic selenocysteine-containing dehydrogenase